MDGSYADWARKNGYTIRNCVCDCGGSIELDTPMEEINDAIGNIDISSCFEPIFEPPMDFLEECRKRWKSAQSSFR